MSVFEDRVIKVLTGKCGRVQNLKPLIYGTAGFRMNYDENPSRVEQVAVICTLIACLRSILEEKWVGIMITASHNPIQDNGVKIVDITGSMLNKEFEQICFNVVNSEDGSSPVKVLMHYFKEKLSLKDDELNKIELSKARLVVGYDTRPSSMNILESIERVVSEFEICKFLNFGFTTTPQLHFMVAFANRLIIDKIPIEVRESLMLEDLIADLEKCDKLNKNYIVLSFFELYFAYHEFYFKELVNLIQNENKSFAFAFDSEVFKSKSNKIQDYQINDKGKLLIDVANGVGKYHVGRISKILSAADLNLKAINCDKPEKLNDGCGAEYIQKNILPPVGLYSNQDYVSNGVDYVAAFDGDADRLIYFVPNQLNNCEGKMDIFLIDGDRISACYTLVIVTLLNQLIGEVEVEAEITPTLSLGVVQTAYANGASSKYLNDLLSTLNPKYFKFSINCVPTGVKHLHRKAEQYDIAVYFEANGHGTVIHKQDKLKCWLEKMSNFGIRHSSCKPLIYFLNLFNPVIGDAISDMFAFEIARKFIQANFGCKFSMCLYDDLCVIQDRVILKRSDLDSLKCEKETEKFLVEPKALQESIDCYISKLNDNCSRAFIRPSGTEEVARVYVESITLERAKDIMKFIKNLLIEYFFKGI